MEENEFRQYIKIEEEKRQNSIERIENRLSQINNGFKSQKELTDKEITHLKHYLESELKVINKDIEIAKGVILDIKEKAKDEQENKKFRISNNISYIGIFIAIIALLIGFFDVKYSDIKNLSGKFYNINKKVEK